MDPNPAQQSIINIDLGPLVGLMQQLLDALNPTTFVPLVINTTGQLLYSGAQAVFLTLWNATLLGIPHALSDQFGPVVTLLPSPAAIAGAGAVLAIALLGVRSYFSTSTHAIFIGELLGRVVKMVAILSLLPWIIATAITVEQALAQGVAVAAINNVFTHAGEQVNGSFDLPMLIGWIVMLWLGVRLWLKLLSNVIHVMVAIVWSPIALVCGFIPESSWVTSLWTREFFGRLAGAVLATIATGLGLAFALTMNGLLVIFGTAAAFLAAADLVDWMARSPGTSLGGVLGRGTSAAAGLVTGGGGPSAATQAANMRSLGSQQSAAATQRFYSFD